jgi:hypothetical protein
MPHTYFIYSHININIIMKNAGKINKGFNSTKNRINNIVNGRHILFVMNNI